MRHKIHYSRGIRPVLYAYFTGMAYCVCASFFIACLQAVCGCLYRGKAPVNEEFAIAGAILDARENRSGVTRPQTACKQGKCFIIVCLLFLSTPIHKSADDFSSTYAVGGLL